MGSNFRRVRASCLPLLACRPTCLPVQLTPGEKNGSARQYNCTGQRQRESARDLDRSTHFFSLASKLLLLLQLILQNVAIGLQLNQPILILAVQEIQFTLQLVFVLLEKLL